jgi:DNA-binding NarL/FixJ family response regulator
MTEPMSSPSPVHVALADDHDILRQGLRLLLSLQPELQVVGEARTGWQAVEVVENLQPDVVVMDISMPELDGLEACRIIRCRQPATQVLILTMHESEEYFLQALRVGAAGYLVKKAAPAELHTAILTIARGEVFLYPGLAKALVRAYLAQSAIPPATPPHSLRNQEPLKTSNIAEELLVLTPREREVLTLVAEGYTNQEIADRLTLSIKTVQAHRANVIEKLDLRDITHLVRFALRHRLIPPEP